MPRSEITTKDGESLEDLLNKVRQAINLYNEKERPFRDMFSVPTDQQTFFQEAPDEDLYWDKIAEGEHPRTVVEEEDEGKWMTIRGDTFAKALGFTREKVQKQTSDNLMRKVQRMLEGAKNTEDALVRNVIMNGIADGSGTWYDVPDYAAYEHDNDHNHVLTSEQLFGDNNNYTAREHLEHSKEHLTHHSFDGPFVALISAQFKRRLRDEITWDASYHIPMASNMRTADVLDLDIIYDNIRAIETPWLTGNEFYLTQVDNDGPVKFYEDEPVTVTTPNGANVQSPGDLLGANGYARFGSRFVDPLRAVNTTADNLA
jgi:hypothetical protein